MTRHPAAVSLSLAALLTFLVLPRPALAWGREAHQVIANVAQAGLSPAARRAVAALLKGATLASVSTDADAWRNNHPETARWHFVNIPLDARGFDDVRDCQPTPQGDCIIAAIVRLADVLRDRSRPEDERAQALRFLVHFVGDIHNPMHVSDRNDRGGNDTSVVFFGRETNLHRVWDSGLFEAIGLTVTAWTRTVERLRAPVNEGGTPEDWAEETLEVARAGYRFPGTRDLGDGYLAAVRPLVELQLLRAGVRLAGLLNEILQ